LSFPVTQFPNVGSIWIAPNNPTLGAANILNVPNQLYFSPHDLSAFAIPAALGVSSQWYGLIKMPIGIWTARRGDVFKPRNIAAEYYIAAWGEHYYVGFPQEFDGAIVVQCNANSTTPRTY